MFLPVATMDVESWSLAGYQFCPDRNRWVAPPGATKGKIGLKLVGTAPYWEHETAEILTLSYVLPGKPVQRWRPGMRAARVVHCKKEPYDIYGGRPGPWGNPFEIGKDGSREQVIAAHRRGVLADPLRVKACRSLVGKTLGCWCAPEPCHCDTYAEFAALPWDLFDWLAAGGHIEFHNAMFEKMGWHHVLVRKHGWPPLNHAQVHCSMATAHVNGYPGALGDLGPALGTDTRKDPEGAALMKIFSIPRNPTKADSRRRIFPHDDPVRFERYQSYCDTDALTEQDASSRMEPMTPAEREAWLLDQTVNWRGMAIDRSAVRDCIAVLEQALDQYGDECRAITGGLAISQGEKILGWIAGRGVSGIVSFDMKKSPIDEQLKRTDLPDDVRRVLEIRALIGSAGVKKLYAMEHRASADDRLRNMFIHHGARTGRPTGEGVQTTNLVKIGPKLIVCPDCGQPHRPDANDCPWCGARTFWGIWGTLDVNIKPRWHHSMVDAVLEIMSCRSLVMVERFFGDAVLCIQGCIRGLLVAGPGKVLVASDYVAIEAVVAAAISGEEWRLEAFRQQQDIYLLSASKITGIPYADYIAYEQLHGEHHPHRQMVGKIAELALGFGGWIGSWRAFDPDHASKSDDELTGIITAWRDASPHIVEMWGGQRRRNPWRDDLYGIEGAMIRAIQSPGSRHDVGPLAFYMTAPFGRYDRLKMRLPSGRELTYHHPQLRPSEKRPGTLAISYWTDNSNVKYGATGWVQMDTWGSRVFENAVQGIAHDLQRFAIKNHEAAGYSLVQLVYDENVAEVAPGFGSLEEFERIMMLRPEYAATWPVRAAGGWSSRRYRKG